jgi:hypothetical protein
VLDVYFREASLRSSFLRVETEKSDLGVRWPDARADAFADPESVPLLPGYLDSGHIGRVTMGSRKHWR